MQTKNSVFGAAFNTYLKAVMQIFHGAVALAHHELFKNLVVIVTTFAQTFEMEVKDLLFIRAILRSSNQRLPRRMFA